jgi:hypothetical protein
LAGLTAAQICVAGGNSNYSGSEKYQPPVPDKKLTQVNQNTETTVSESTTATKAETPADLADKGKLASKEKAKNKKAQKAAVTQALPVTLTCDLADYDPETGDFFC